MNNFSRDFAAVAVAAAVMLPAGAALAQYGGAGAQPAPLYPYAVKADQPYAVEVAPNTYVIQRPAAARAYPYVRGRGVINAAPEQSAPHHRTKREVINTTKIVREPSVVIETKRYVDDPPRVIERRRVVEDAPVRPRRKQVVAEQSDTEKRTAPDDKKPRVIEADAEVTILGPDRMSIRLFRKGHGSKANARVE